MKIYPKDDKRRLYWLIDLYVAGTIDDKTFCDEFYYSYDLEIEGNTLTEIEKNTFEELAVVSRRYYGDIDDPEVPPRTYTTGKQLKEAIIKAREALNRHKKDLL